MRLVLFFLFVVSKLFAELGIAAVTENEPSSIVEGVSVITGDFCTRNHVYTVQGAEPIHLSSTYISEGVCLTGYEHCKMSYKWRSYFASIREPYGTQIDYFLEGLKEKRKEKKKKKIDSCVFTTDQFLRVSQGIANTASGTLSAQTNIKNHRLVLTFYPGEDLSTSWFVFYASDGTVRHYGRAKGRDKTEIPNSGMFRNDTIYQTYEYLLMKEDLPNGHVLHYCWCEDNLSEIRATNKSGNKVFSSLRVSHRSPEFTEYVGTDNQKASLRFVFSPEAKSFVLQKILSPNQLDLSFGWTAKQLMVAGKAQQRGYMSSLSLDGGKTFCVCYNMGDKHTKPKVSHLQAPVGKDAKLHNTHCFIYGNHKTDVYDIQGNKTCYYWNGDGRLTVIEYFIGDKTFHSKEHFFWNGPLLISRCLWDDKGVCKYVRSFEYDSYGNVIQSCFSGNLTGSGGPVCQNPNGSVDRGRTETCVTYTTYSDKHLPLRVEEPSGLLTLYTYIPGTNLVKTKTLCDKDIPKITHTYDYDEDFLLIREVIDDGVSKKIKRIFPKQSQPFLGMPEIIEEKYVENGQEKLLKKRGLFYRAGAKIEREDIYDANGQFQYSISYEYDEKNRVIRETNPLGQIALAKYDASGNRCFYQDFGSLVTETSEYDFSNRLIKKICKAPDKERIYEYSYDTKHRLEWESDERGHKIFYQYDFLGRCIETKEKALYTVPGQIVYPTSKRAYDAMGNEILRIDADGFATKTEYSSYGKPLHILHPDGTEEYFTYTLKGDLESHIAPSGIKTAYKYDYLSRILEKTLLQNNTPISQETFCYTGYLLTSQTDPEGNTTTYQYDGAGRKIAETFGGETIHYGYDALGRIATIEEGGEITRKTYDLLDRVIEEQKESLSGTLLQKTLYEYDEAGNQTAVTRFVDGQTAKDTFVYDALHRLIQKTDPLGFVETISYNDIIDEYGQRVLQKVHTDALGLQTIETLDPQGNLQSIEKRKEKTLVLSQKFYTPSKNLSLQVDTIFAPNNSQRSVSTRWEYDCMRREIALIEAANTPEEKITRKTYTPTGELKTLTKPDQTVITYTYNGLKQLIAIDSSDGSVQHRMSYNRLGHLQTTDQIQRTTDPKGRVLSETFPGGCTLSQFDEYGRRVSFEIPSKDMLILYSYLGKNLQKISRLSERQELYYHEYLERDLSRKILKEQLIDAKSLKTQAFDLLSRKVSVQSPFFSQTLDLFDPVGNLLSMTRQEHLKTYQYDDLYQLTQETGHIKHDYSYDSLNNRLTKDDECYQVNALHQATSHFLYNANGCPVQGQNVSYVYDALDRLIEISLPGSLQRFTYDSLHRCQSKTTYRGHDKTIQYFLYDGQKEIGALDENLQLREFRILGETPHAELGAAISIELDGKIFLPLHDLQHNLATLVSLNDSSLTSYDYSAFGEETVEGSPISPWTFSSKRLYKDSGLIHYGRRFYIPTLGRWLTPDPSGFTDGMNLYAFVKNEPLMHFDEYGLHLTPRPPGSFSSSEIFRNWTQTASATWWNPRFQGSLQAFSGLSIMAQGAPLVMTPLAPAGLAWMAFGADVFTTGLHAVVHGTERPTLTRTLLEGAGAPPMVAGLAEFMISWRGGPKLGNQISGLTAKNLGLFEQLKSAPKFRPFTKNYYRDNLKVLTGKNPPNNIDAHHIFPQKFRKEFLKKGINIDDPQYLIWWESKLHRPTASTYNGYWEKFFFQNPEATPNQILEAGKELMKDYGLSTNY